MLKEELANMEGPKAIDLKKLVYKMLSIWPWAILSIALCIGGAFAYLYMVRPKYNVNATILIRDGDKKMGNADMNMLQNIGLLSGASSVDNELQILKSYSLMSKVVSDMRLFVSFYTNEGFKGLKKTPLYGASLPFVAHFTGLRDSLLEETQEYQLTFDGHGGITIAQEEKTWRGHMDEMIELPVGMVVFRAADATGPGHALHGTFGMMVRSPEAVTFDLMEALKAEIPNKQVSAIHLTMATDLPAKGVDVLNRFIEVYIRANIDDNNRIADSTSAFIDVRLMTIGEELAGIEQDIQNFMQKNELANIAEQSRALIDNTSEYAKNLAQQEVQLNVVEALEGYLKNNLNNPRIVPTSLMVQNPALTATIDKYNNLLLQRERLLLSSTEDNPMVKNLDAQLTGLRGDLVANLRSVRNSMEVAVNALRRKSGHLESQMKQVPAKQREFLDYSRQQSIKQELYLFLLQKREEAAISKSSTIANARIIDPAKADRRPFSPRKSVLLPIGLLCGLLLPFAFVYVRALFNTKVNSREDIESHTDVPIIVEVGHEQGKQGVVVARASRSPVAEQFRVLRTNLQYLLTNSNEQVIMVTSSMPGEGKTFVSANLAAILAFSGKRVALLEMDLRKPKISPIFGLSGRKGFSHYAIGQASLDEILVRVPEYESLYVMPSGPVPPNPAELLMMDKTKDMFRELRERFDYVIIDTTPNIVTDAQVLAGQADATLYLVRVGVTYKSQLRQSQDLMRAKKMPKINLVVNDVNYKKYGGYYGSGHYGNYDYYGAGPAQEQDKKWFHKSKA